MKSMRAHILAAYDVDIAKQVGVPAAILLAKLAYYCRYTQRDDGFCWRTARQLEDELALSPAQQALAIEKLEQAGYLETKNTWIPGTQVKCKHYKVLLDIESEIGTETMTTPQQQKDERFETFWKLYPRKAAKAAAEKAFHALKPSKAMYELMLKGLEEQKKSAQWQDPQYIPHAATWIRQRRWEDEPIKGRRLAAFGSTQKQYTEAELALLNPDFAPNE